MVEMKSGALIRVTVGVLLILVLAQGVQAATAITYSFVKEWPGPGNPWGIAVDNGWVYAADPIKNVIQKNDTDGGKLFTWNADNWGVAVDKNGIVYTDGNITNNNRYIDKYDSNGNLISSIVTTPLPSARGLAVDSSGNIYVADFNANQIRKFDSFGNTIKTWGSPGGKDGQFNGPKGIAVDRTNGWVYVTDQANNRIQKFDTDGKFLLKWGTKGSNRDGAFNGPEGVAVDKYSNVYVTDVSNYQVQKFNSSGIFMTRWGTFGTNPGNFTSPSGIAVDSNGNVYVADYSTNRIEKFAPNKMTPTITWSDQPDIIYGTALSATQLKATTSVLGNFVYTPAAGTVLSAGQGQTLHVDFTPTDTQNYNNADKTVYINVLKANPTIVVTPYDVTYDATAHTAEGSAKGVGDVNLAGLVVSGTTHTDAGDYATDAWTFTDVTGNYNDKSGTVHDKIAKADATIEINGYTGVYDAAEHGASIKTATGVAGADLSGSVDLGEIFTNVPGGNARWLFTNANYADESGYAAITITDAPPVARFSYEPTSGPVPLTVTFTDQSTGAITGYAWDFENDGIVDSSDPSPPPHEYTPAGIYTVNLTVTGPGGTDTNITQSITVETVTQSGAVIISEPPVTGATGSVSEMLPKGTCIYDGVQHTLVFCFEEAGGYIIVIDTCQPSSDDPTTCIPATGDHPFELDYINSETGEMIKYYTTSQPYVCEESTGECSPLPTTKVSGQDQIPYDEGNSIKSFSANPGKGLGYLGTVPGLVPICDSPDKPDCSKNYALLIDGGMNRDQNHIRYWSAISFMYQTLNQTYGYPTNHITILMSDGMNQGLDRHYDTINGVYYNDSSPVNIDDTSATTESIGVATKANIIQNLTDLNGKLTATDNLFIFTTGHGGPDKIYPGVNNSVYYTWGDGYINDTEFVSKLPTKPKNITMVMTQCNSGGFIDNFLKNKPASQSRVIATAANGSESSWGDGFSNAWIEAVARINDQREPNFRADTNPDNGMISMWEAWNYTLTYDLFAQSSATIHEHPQYGANISTAGDTQYLSTCQNIRPITVLSPNGGETWYEGYKRTITWDQNGLSGKYVKIELFNGISNTKSTIADSVLATQQSYVWDIPKTKPAGQTVGTLYRINITETSLGKANDSSNAAFTIMSNAPNGTISVTSVSVPNTTVAGATIYIDEVLQISKLTNRTGSTKLVNISPGTHTVKVTKSGYYDDSYKGDVLPGSTASLIVPTFILKMLEANDPEAPIQPPAGHIVVTSKDLAGNDVQAEVLIGGGSSGAWTNGGPIEIDPDATYFVTVQANGYDIPPEQEIYVPSGETIEVDTFMLSPSKYIFTGFESPVIMTGPNEIDTRKISTIPFKWHLSDTLGNNVLDPASFVSISSYNVTCPPGPIIGDPKYAKQEVSAGNTGLQNLTNGNWQFNMKIDKKYVNTCRKIYAAFNTGDKSPEVLYKFR